ncbi:RNA polymerase I enhancer binding protein [Didymella heteroderae]|uniref:RNA polymerase I enhancer binding protein n=1 Tax=Didymella heteroderae TaxID=1769908 RepID=A0A9P5BZA8_9PLEO|nr:RNA polymerase I enhancer binding protein [Didymella heteroderae]
MGVSSSQPIPSSQYIQPHPESFTPTATPNRIKRVYTHTPTMDDEAAAEQLMSEARASYSANHNDNAIPLRLGGANLPETSKKKSKELKKLEKLGKLGKSHKPKKSNRKHLAASQTSPSQLPTHEPTDSRALIAESPLKSQILPSTAPDAKIEVPNSQVANSIPASMPVTSGHAASPGDTKSKSKKRKRKRQIETETQDEVIPATPQEEADEGQSSQKRRKKHQSQASVHSVYADAEEVATTPGATLDVLSEPAFREEKDGAVPTPLTPRALLENLNAERLQRMQGSQSSSKAHTSARRKQKNVEMSPADVDAEEHIADVEGELPDAAQSLNRKKKSSKNKHILEAPKLDWEAPARSLDDSPPKLSTFDDIEATEPMESNRKEKKRKKKLTKSEESTKSSRYSVGGLPKSPSKRPSKHDPNKNYERARDEDDRTAADRALESSRDLGHPPELRTSGDYSSDEDELLRRAIRDFQQREALETADLVRIIHWMPTKEDITGGATTDQAETELKKQSAAFWEEVKGTGVRRKMKNIKEHVRATYHTYHRGPWSLDEDEQLRGLVDLYPNQWKLIATHLNRLRGDVFNRWKDYVQHGPDRVTKRWSQEEEETFVKVLSTVIQRVEDNLAETGKPPLDDYFSSINWSHVCKEMGNTRSRLQCQYKLKQMRARVPPPTFDFEIRPRRTPPPDEIEVGPVRDGEEGADKLDASESESKKRKRHSGAGAGKKQKKQAEKHAKKQDFKSKELVSESDSAESEPEV